jgi:hypothetical protein
MFRALPARRGNSRAARVHAALEMSGEPQESAEKSANDKTTNDKTTLEKSK